MILSVFWYFCSHSTFARWISVIPGVELTFICSVTIFVIVQHQHYEANCDHKKSRKSYWHMWNPQSEETLSFIRTVLLSAKKYGPISCLLITHGNRYVSPFHSEPIFHLLHSVVLGVQQLFGSLLSNAAEPWVVQLSHVGVVFWEHGALCPVNLLHFLEKLLWVLTR